MPRDRVFVTRRRVSEAIDVLKEHFDVEVWEGKDPPPKSLVVERAAECQGLMTEIDDIIDSEVLDAGESLKIVANRAVGLDNVDVERATRRGIAVSNTPGVLHESCADFTFGLLLAAARNVAFGDRQVRAGAWTVFDQTPYLGVDVFGATLGIVGLGQIGQAVARRARGFDMRVLYRSLTRNRRAEEEMGVTWAPDLPALLRESDFVSVHVPLSDDTRGLIGVEELGQMKTGAILINTSRGGTVDTGAVYEALTSGTLGGAALDVTDPEPIPADHPILSLPNVVVTPHISSGSRATVRNMAMIAAANIVEALTGRPISCCVNGEALRAAGFDPRLGPS